VFSCEKNDDQNQAPHRTQFVLSLENEIDNVCPFVTLHGKIIRHTFPGPPNFESIEDGDQPETKWVLVIEELEIQHLLQAKILQQEDVYESQKRMWIQLIPPQTEDDPIPFLDKKVIVEGYIGTLAFRAYTRATIETTAIYGDK
jgi:hypothetical protein